MRLIFLHLVPPKPGSQAGQARLTWSIPALSAATGARLRRPDASNRSVYFSLVDQITFFARNSSIFGWRYVCTREEEFFETEMGENTVHHAPTHLGPASS
jgi:hypothetical protein